VPACVASFGPTSKNLHNLLTLTPRRRRPLERGVGIGTLPLSSFLGHWSTRSCLEWVGLTRGGGYGVVEVLAHGRVRRKRVGAHRRAWILTYGPIPAGMLVCHRCDNPPCVEPTHLFLGTPKDNVRDCMAKGRFVGLDKVRWTGSGNAGRCKKGHELTLRYKDKKLGVRMRCEPCERARAKNGYWRRLEARKAAATA
jgi:hypothetical protein